MLVFISVYACNTPSFLILHDNDRCHDSSPVDGWNGVKYSLVVQRNRLGKLELNQVNLKLL
jgi:hypothetical protein